MQEDREVKTDPRPRWERRDVASPLTNEMLKPFTAERGVIQFQSRLTDDDFRVLADWLRPQPNVGLRAYGSYDGTITDLEFLKHFPWLRSFAADALFSSLRSLDGLRHLESGLESLVIGQTKTKLDLQVLRQFGELRELHIEGQTKGIDTVSLLTSLEEITLRSITLPDLALLLPLRRLNALNLKLGGTRDLELLPRIGELRYLELWMVKGLTDVAGTARLPTLRYLFLQSLARVTTLPSFAESTDLRRIHLETMKGLTAIAPVGTAPALESLVVVDCRQFGPQDFEPLVGHPTLRSARIGTGSQKRNDAINNLLRLPDAGYKISWRDV
jgi:hypothetical protein